MKFTWKQFILCLMVFGLFPQTGELQAKDPEFLSSKNIIRRKSKDKFYILHEFYGDFYIPDKMRRDHPKGPPAVPHKINGDFRKCNSCHTTKTLRKPRYSGIAIPWIPKEMPTEKYAKHPTAEGSCRICHVNQSKKFRFSDFYLKEVLPKVYRPKLR